MHVALDEIFIGGESAVALAVAAMSATMQHVAHKPPTCLKSATALAIKICFAQRFPPVAQRDQGGGQEGKKRGMCGLPGLKLIA